MGRIIQVRGNSAVGKTSAIRQLLKRFDGQRVVYNGLPAMELNTTPKSFVLGDYTLDLNCVGPDRFKEGPYDIKLLMQDAVDHGTQCIIFEHMMSGHTYKSAKLFEDLAHRMGFEYIPVLLMVDYEIQLERLLRRNQGKSINAKALLAKHDAALRSQQKLVERDGIKGLTIDTGRMNPQQVADILQQLMEVR